MKRTYKLASFAPAFMLLLNTGLSCFNPLDVIEAFEETDYTVEEVEAAKLYDADRFDEIVFDISLYVLDIVKYKYRKAA